MKKSLLLLCICLPIFVIPKMTVAENIPNVPHASKTEILQKFKNLSKDKFTYNIDSSNEKFFISGILSSEKIVTDSDIIHFIDQNKAIFNLDTIQGKLKVQKSEKDSLGFTHVTLCQCIDGVPIKDKFITVHCNQNGQVINITANIESKISTISKLGDKSLTTEEAVKIAKEQFTYKKLAYEPKVETIIYIKDNHAYKTYKVNIKCSEPVINSNVYIEVSSGNILKKEDNIRYDKHDIYR